MSALKTLAFQKRLGLGVLGVRTTRYFVTDDLIGQEKLHNRVETASKVCINKWLQTAS
jgi:hypothetical protein